MSAFLRWRLRRTGARGRCRGQLPLLSRTRKRLQFSQDVEPEQSGAPNRAGKNIDKLPDSRLAGTISQAEESAMSCAEIRRRSYATALYGLGPTPGCGGLVSEWLAPNELAQRPRTDTNRVRAATAPPRCHL